MTTNSMVSNLITNLSSRFQENSESTLSANIEEESKGEVGERQPIVTIERVLSY